MSNRSRGYYRRSRHRSYYDTHGDYGYVNPPENEPIWEYPYYFPQFTDPDERKVSHYFFNDEVIRSPFQREVVYMYTPYVGVLGAIRDERDKKYLLSFFTEVKTFIRHAISEGDPRFRKIWQAAALSELRRALNLAEEMLQKQINRYEDDYNYEDYEE